MGNEVRYGILNTTVVFLIIQFFITDYSNFFDWKNLRPFIVIICIIIAMSVSSIHVNKHAKNN